MHDGLNHPIFRNIIFIHFMYMLWWKMINKNKGKKKSDGVTRFLVKKLNPISWSSMNMIKKKRPTASASGMFKSWYWCGVILIY